MLELKFNIRCNMSIRIEETYSCSKAGDTAHNEDVIVVAPGFRYIAVVDGSSLAADERFHGMTGGKYAAQLIANAIVRLPDDIDAVSGVRAISQNLRENLDAACRAQGKDIGQSLAAAAMVVYSSARNEIWSVADCPFMVDGQEYVTRLKVAEFRASARQYKIHELLEGGMTEADLLANDPTPAMIAKEMMKDSKRFANSDNPVFGYGVINGNPVPERHIKVVSVGAAREVVLASDGYPKIFNTLTQTEAYLADVNAKDPLCYKENPQPKAVKGGRYYDDVSYVRFSINRAAPAA